MKNSDTIEMMAREKKVCDEDLERDDCLRNTVHHSDVSCRASLDDGETDDEDSEEDDFDDIYSTTIRNETQGVALYGVISTATCMALVSIVMILEYTPPHSSRETSTSDTVCDHPRKVLPLWADLLASQVTILQNLIHASLLGGAGIVACK
jgi:hypothetical protein